MNNEKQIIELERYGYQNVRLLPSGFFAGVMAQMFTTALFVGLDATGYQRRYCYESDEDAISALAAWDGTDDPPGNWIKEKPSDRLNPNWSAKA